MDRPTTFELKEDHIKLLRRMYVDWWDAEFGAPAIDSKRPYGDSDVILSIAKILGVESSGDSYEPFSPEQEDKMYRLHQETEIALQIVLQHGYLPGRYECGKYDINWQRSVDESD